MSVTDTTTLREIVTAMARKHDITLAQLHAATGGRFTLLEIEAELAEIADSICDNGDRALTFRARYSGAKANDWPTGATEYERTIWLNTFWRYGGAFYSPKPRGGRRKGRAA